jgi:hypothetical protein
MPLTHHADIRSGDAFTAGGGGSRPDREVLSGSRRPAMQEVCPLADWSTMAALCARGYRPIEFTSVMFLPWQERAHRETPPNAVHLRAPGPKEHETWARTVAEGWRELLEFQDSMLALARVTAARSGIVLFLAEIGDSSDRRRGVEHSRRPRPVFRHEHGSGIPQARRSTGAARSPAESCYRVRLRPGDDVRGARKHVAAKRGAPGIPGRLHASSVGAALKSVERTDKPSGSPARDDTVNEMGYGVSDHVPKHRADHRV